MTDLPVHISQDQKTRIIVENRDGVLVARVQRRVKHAFVDVEDGEWTDFAEASGANGSILIQPV